MKKLGYMVLCLSMFMSFSNCKSAYKHEESNPIKIGQAYYQNWVSGIEDGGSGIKLFIPIIDKPESVSFDSVYFRGKHSNLGAIDENLMVANFKNDIKKKDKIMSSEPFAEYGNEAPILTRQKTLDLNEDECLLSYTKDNKTKYMKVSGLIKKQTLNYPTVPTKD